MPLREGFSKLALILQEQADAELSHNDLNKWISDACMEIEGQLLDVYGDSTSGDAIICCDGEIKRVPYSIDSVNGKATAHLDMENAEDVLPHTTYQPEADEADHYASMEAKRDHKLMPLYERFISKAERDSADSGSFAGKGRSFPILKPADVQAAVRSMGRAGADNSGTSTIKAKIISIAKAKGWTKYLPKAWQGASDDKKESLKAGAVVGDLKLVESAVSFIDQVRLEEATRSDYAIKLISPGKGTSAFYPAEVLKRDGPSVFKAGTQMYWNHATEAEEAARPEGNMDYLAAVLTTNAFWDEGGARGPGLYARAKVFSDYGEKVAEKGPHTGLSIRASGNAEKGKLIEGRPVLKELTYADSVDFVTKAGAGGMVLTESARKQESQIQEEEALTEMEAAEIKKLQESVKKQAQRIALWEARDFADEQIKDLRLPDAVKQRIRERALVAAPIATDGTLDEAAFKTLIESEAKEEAAYLQRLTGGRMVTGMGSPAPAAPPDPIKAKEAVDKELTEIGAALGLSESGAKTFAKGRAA